VPQLYRLEKLHAFQARDRGTEEAKRPGALLLSITHLTQYLWPRLSGSAPYCRTYCHFTLEICTSVETCQNQSILAIPITTSIPTLQWNWEMLAVIWFYAAVPGFTETLGLISATLTRQDLANRGSVRLIRNSAAAAEKFRFESHYGPEWLHSTNVWLRSPSKR
jgi:hypothetical protein